MDAPQRKVDTVPKPLPLSTRSRRQDGGCGTPSRELKIATSLGSWGGEDVRVRRRHEPDGARPAGKLAEPRATDRAADGRTGLGQSRAREATAS